MPLGHVNKNCVSVHAHQWIATAAAAFGQPLEKVLNKEKDKPPAQLSACYAGGGVCLVAKLAPSKRTRRYLLWLASSGLMKLNWNGDLSCTCTMTWPQAMA